MAEEGHHGAHAHGQEYYGGDRVFPCVKLRGIPFDAEETDVKTFLVSPKRHSRLLITR